MAGEDKPTYINRGPHPLCFGGPDRMPSEEFQLGEGETITAEQEQLLVQAGNLARKE